MKLRDTLILAGGPGSGRHKTLYHGTTVTNAEKIRKEGLRKGSFLTEDKDKALSYGWGRANTKGSGNAPYALLKIRVPVEHVSEQKATAAHTAAKVLKKDLSPDHIIKHEHYVSEYGRNTKVKTIK